LLALFKSFGNTPSFQACERTHAYQRLHTLLTFRPYKDKYAVDSKNLVSAWYVKNAITYYALTRFFVRTKIMFPPQLNKRMTLEKDTETYQQTAARLLKRTRRWRGM
jgi:hypothetical protein